MEKRALFVMLVASLSSVSLYSMESKNWSPPKNSVTYCRSCSNGELTEDGGIVMKEYFRIRKEQLEKISRERQLQKEKMKQACVGILCDAELEQLEDEQPSKLEQMIKQQND